MDDDTEDWTREEVDWDEVLAQRLRYDLSEGGEG